jgi:hypothetical protein
MKFMQMFCIAALLVAVGCISVALWPTWAIGLSRLLRGKNSR